MRPATPTFGRPSVPRTTCSSDTPERCRSTARWGCRGGIGITLDLQVATPDGDSDENRRAAELGDGYTNRWFLDPLFRARYPSDVEALFDDRGAGLGDALEPGDLAAIAAPLDFLGMNFYMRRWYRAVPDGLGFTERLAREGDDTTEMGWGIVPDAMGEQLARLRADYPPIPLYITENGMADREGVGADGAGPRRRGGSTTCGATSRWPRRRSPRAPTCAGTSCGASWTTSNGGSGTGRGSGSSTSTTRRWRGPPRTARAGTRG